MIKYLQLPFHFDASGMRAEVSGLAANGWKLHYQKLHYEGEWSAIPLRSINGAIDNIYISPTGNDEYKDTILLDECPYIKDILTKFECPLMAVRLLKLNAGAIIKEHKDHELCYEKGEVRIHIPVRTHELVEFYLDKERINVKEGECWYMNFNLPHSIVNNSDIDRIHLVIDAKVNDWAKRIFDDSTNKKEIEEPGIDDETKKQMIYQLRSMNTDTSNRMADELENK